MIDQANTQADAEYFKNRNAVAVRDYQRSMDEIARGSARMAKHLEMFYELAAELGFSLDGEVQGIVNAIRHKLRTSVSDADFWAVAVHRDRIQADLDRTCRRAFQAIGAATTHLSSDHLANDGIKVAVQELSQLAIFVGQIFGDVQSSTRPNWPEDSPTGWLPVGPGFKLTDDPAPDVVEAVADLGEPIKSVNPDVVPCFEDSQAGATEPAVAAESNSSDALMDFDVEGGMTLRLARTFEALPAGCDLTITTPAGLRFDFRRGSV